MVFNGLHCSSLVLSGPSWFLLECRVSDLGSALFEVSTTLKGVPTTSVISPLRMTDGSTDRLMEQQRQTTKLLRMAFVCWWMDECWLALWDFCNVPCSLFTVKEKATYLMRVWGSDQFHMRKWNPNKFLHVVFRERERERSQVLSFTWLHYRFIFCHLALLQELFFYFNFFCLVFAAVWFNMSNSKAWSDFVCPCGVQG